MMQTDLSARLLDHPIRSIQARDRDDIRNEPCDPSEPPDTGGGDTSSGGKGGGGMPAPSDPHGAGNGGKD